VLQQVLDAFKQLLKAIPIDSGMFVLVQHLDPNHESILTEILQNPLQFLF
jgi:two-component system CheB/CheR fusion protein